MVYCSASQSPYFPLSKRSTRAHAHAKHFRAFEQRVLLSICHTLCTGKLCIDVGWPPQNNSCRYMDLLPIINGITAIYRQHTLPKQQRTTHGRTHSISISLSRCTRVADIPDSFRFIRCKMCFECDRKNLKIHFVDDQQRPPFTNSCAHLERYLLNCLKNDFPHKSRSIRLTRVPMQSERSKHGRN